MSRSSASRLVGSIKDLVEETARAVGRELRTAIRALQTETRADIRRIEKRIDKLERQLARTNGQKSASRKNAEACKREGCQEPALARSLCSRHYQQMRYRKTKKRRK